MIKAKKYLGRAINTNVRGESMKVTIDRFEGEYAVCEKTDRTMINIKKDNLPVEAREGDVLVIDGEDIRIDTGATSKRKKAIRKLMDDLWK
jgi:hypothetical protein